MRILLGPALFERIEQCSGREMHHNVDTLWPLKYKMGNSILFLSTCMGKSIGRALVWYSHTAISEISFHALCHMGDITLV